MNNRKLKIEKIVENIFSKYKDKLDNNNDIINWKEEALNRFLNSNLSLEEVERLIEDEVERKIKLSNIKHNYYEKYEHICKVAESIGNVPEEVIENIILMVDQYLYENHCSFDDISKDDLTKLCIADFRKYRSNNISVSDEVPKIIETVLNSFETKELLTSILSNEETLRVHSEISADGTYLAHNVYRVREVIDFLTKYIIIHQGEYKMDVLYQELNKVNLNTMGNKELNNFFSKIILLSVKARLGLEEIETVESRKKIAEFIKENYIEKGFCFQGLNGIYKNSILENGLTNKFSRQEDNKLVEIDEIFKKHGLKKIFYSKLDETKISPYFYLTDKIGTAYHYSYHNPEWFSYFCGMSNYMPDYLYDKIAYYMRDHDTCKKNLEILCSKYNLDDKERKVVIDFFENYWQKIVGDNKSNSIVFVPRSIINRNNINYDLNNSAIGIVSELTKSNYDIDVQFIDIPKESIYVIDVPLLSNFYDKKTANKSVSKRNLFLNNGNYFTYDILIHADDIDIDCISIVNTPEPFMTKTKTNFRRPIDVINCSSKIDENAIISNGHTSYQSLQMMIAVNGIGNSLQGAELINQARTNYTPQYMSNYYYYLSEIFCNIALDESISNNERASALVRVAKDLFPKAELMKITNDYPQFINEDNNVFCYLKYKNRLLLKQAEEIRITGTLEDKEIDVNSVLIELASFFKNELKDRLDPNFENEFKNKLGTFVKNDSIYEKYISSGNNFTKK